MTEQDYVLLCIGAQEKQLNDMKVVRFLAWNSYIGPHVNPETMYRSITQFMDLGDKVELQPIPKEVLIQWDKQFRGLA